MRCLSSLIILMFVGGSAHAGPDATTNWLMDEPASMLDLGLLRLNMQLQQAKLGSASFNWDTNRVQIYTFQYFNEVQSDETDPEALCRKWVMDVRAEGFISEETGKALYDYSSYSAHFTHAGFKRKSTPDKLEQSVDSLTELSCLIMVGTERTRVTAPLLGTAIFVEK